MQEQKRCDPTKRRRVWRILAMHVGILAAVGLFIGALDYFSIGCPIRFLTGVPCPTCGTTRALLSLARLDLRGYVYYNPLALPVCVVLWLALHSKLLHWGKRAELSLLIGTAVVVLGVYLYRLCTNSIP